MGKPLIQGGEFMALRKRRLTEETCKKFGYVIADDERGRKIQIAPYRDFDGTVVAQKLRAANKKFSTRGDFKADQLQLFGQHLWQAGGKRVVITEGEIDAMSLSQAQGNKWPVVSLPSGADSWDGPLRANLEWLSSFEEVVLCFDMDEVGQENAKQAAELFKPGQAKIAQLPMKDASEMLIAGREKDLVSCMWNAKEFRPDGLIEIDDILEEIEKPVEWGLPWWMKSLTNYTYGRRWGEVYGFGAGTGIGKTDWFTQQIEYDISVLEMRVGVIYLEQKPTETATRIAGKLARKQFHIPDAGWTPAEKKEAVRKLRGKVTMYDSWGETDWQVVANKIRYMVRGLGIKLIYLDHLTAMADPANEKESLETIMKQMAGLANELGCIIHFISHLTTPEGKPHEEGGRVMIRHFKGSRAIGFWSYFMFGLERNQQADDPDEAQTTIFRILKDRYTGQSTGKTIALGYDAETGLLYEKSAEEADDYGFTPPEEGSDTPPWEGSSDF